MIALIKKYRIIPPMIIPLLFACSNESGESKTPSPHQNVIDSLSLVKENESIKAEMLINELDSLQKHLDSLKAISVDSTK